MKRASGILLHPTSLPGDFPVGDIGQNALIFIDFLAKTGQSVWQILPLGPTGYGHSPYNALSAFAGNPALIDLNQLVDCGDLDKTILNRWAAKNSLLSFTETLDIKKLLLQSAGNSFFENATPDRLSDFNNFCDSQSEWLEDFSLFMALKDHFNGRSWDKWPENIRARNKEDIISAGKELEHECNLVRYQQFIFSEQWQKLKTYANQQGVRIFGDIPIFVAYDSADVWANQHLFQLDRHGKASAVAGVPPDYFSKTGQRWGNPLYQWKEHLADNFNWWLRRFRYQLESCDLVRIDHFRGFQACWSISANEKTAVNGHWEEVPGRQLFALLREQFEDLPIIAEDLGIITPEVEKLRDDFGFPGMKILQFAFDSGPDNPYLPENHCVNSVVYTGTHDNNTTLGWWQSLSKEKKDIIRQYLGKKRPEMPWDLIRLAMDSCANLCILPCQDILALDSKARFNTPGRATGNWQWQLPAKLLTDELAHRLLGLTQEKNRQHVR